MTAATHVYAAPGLSLRSLLHTFFRRKWLIIIGALAGLIAAIGLFVATPTVYRSEAKLLLRYVADTTILDPAAAGGRILSPDRYGENVINSEMEILSSRDLVERAVAEIGEDRFVTAPAPEQKRVLAVSVAMANLHVEVPKRSSVFRIYFDASDPVLARDFLKRLIDLYLEKHIEIHRSVGAYDFLSKQTDQVRAKLSETEEQLRRIKAEAGVVSVDEEKKMLITRLEELGKALRDGESEMAAARARVDVLHPLPSTNLAKKGAAPAAAGAEGGALPYERLAKLQQKEAELLLTYREDSIPVRRIREQIQEVRRSISKESGIPLAAVEMSSTNAESTLLLERANIAAIQARIRLLNEQTAKARQEILHIDEIESQIVQLERTREIQEANYKYFAKSLEQARIDDALDSGKISNISIVQPASSPDRKVRPNLSRNMGMALALGLLCGLGLAFLLEDVLNRTLKTPAQVEAVLQMPVILSIPDVSRNGRSGGVRGRKARPAAAPAPSPDTPMPQVLTELKDHYETLRDRLVAATAGVAHRPRVLGITSCGIGSGVTTIASGLALALSRSSNDRVALLDVSLERAGSHRVFGSNPSGGVTDIVSDHQGNTAVVERNLYLVSNLPVETGLGVSLSEQVRAMVQQTAQGDYDFVVLDMPPLGDTSLALRAASYIDAMILVIEAEKVDEEAAKRARELLMREKTRLVGVVLNKSRSYIPRWLQQVV